MRIIAIKTLRLFWEDPKYRETEQSLKAWFDEAKNAQWRTPHDIKSKYRNASFVHDNRVVFNICGNKYRLITAIKYDSGIVFIRFIGTHKQYNEIDAATI